MDDIDDIDRKAYLLLTDAKANTLWLALEAWAYAVAEEAQFDALSKLLADGDGGLPDGA
jgi:hypothetical protein